MSTNWIPIWHQAIALSFMNGITYGKKRTVVFKVHSPVSGSAVRIRFSNRLGKKDYRIGALRITSGSQAKNITMNGKKSFSIPVSSLVYSDTIPMDIPEHCDLTIEMYYENLILDSNMIEEDASLIKGNVIGKNYDKSRVYKSFITRRLDANNGIPSINLIEVESSADTKTIVAFGDSITAQSRWTKPLQKRLEDAYGDQYTLLNSGIIGNCLLYNVGGMLGGVFGDKGVDRFKRDVLEMPNLYAVILALGVNDVSYYSDETKDIINLETYKNAITDIVDQLRRRNVRVIMQTITPRLHVAKQMGVYTPEMEELRLSLNDWIRSSQIFDYVYDAEAQVCDTDDTGIFFKEGCHAGDHLHPNAKGGKAMADGYDLVKLTGEAIG